MSKEHIDMQQKSQSKLNNLSLLIQGVWWLVSRQDFTKDGMQKIDPVLGASPIGILTYAKSHFAAQFMRGDRKDERETTMFHNSQKNNTGAIEGYDAYFGTYEVIDEANVVHELIGSINRMNIGMTVTRKLSVVDNHLTITIETTAADNCEPITRVLVWNRVS